MMSPRLVACCLAFSVGVILPLLPACSNNTPPLLRRVGGATRFEVFTDRCFGSADAERRNFAVLSSPQVHGVRVVDLDNEDFFDEPQLRPLVLTISTGRHPNAIAKSPDDCFVFTSSPVEQSVTVLDFADILATNLVPEEALSVGRFDIAVGGAPADVIGAPADLGTDTVAWVAVHASTPEASRTRIMAIRRDQTATSLEAAFSVEDAFEVEGQIARLTVSAEASGPTLWAALDGFEDTEVVRIDLNTGTQTRVEVGGPTKQVLPVPAGELQPAGASVEAQRYLFALRSSSPGIAVLDLAHVDLDATPTPTPSPMPTPTATPEPAVTPTPVPQNPVWLDLSVDPVMGQRPACGRSARHCDMPLPSIPLSMAFQDGYSVEARTNLDGCTSEGNSVSSPYGTGFFGVLGTLDGVAYLVDANPAVFGIADSNADEMAVTTFVPNPPTPDGPCFAGCDAHDTAVEDFEYTATECLQVQDLGPRGVEACAQGVVILDPRCSARPGR